MTSKGPERSLTIHHVAPHFYPGIGGLEDSVRRFSAWLVERGHHVVVHTSALTISGERLAPRDSIDGIEIRRYEPIARRGYYRTLFRPDLSAAQLIHLHGYAVRTNDRVVREYRDRRLAFSLHHGVRMPHVDARTRVLRRGYDTLVGLRTLRRVGRIVVPSVADRDWLAHHRVPADRVSILPTPLPKEAFDAGNSSWASAQTGGAPFVLYLGRLHQEKGVDDLLETVPHLPASIRLMYAGPDGGRLDALRNRARELRVEDRVRFLGVVSEGQKRSLLATCSALALPSLFEAQGLAVLEAWALGRPVVATRVGALAETISDGETGLLVPYHDVAALTQALIRVSTDRDLARKMGSLGREAAEAFRLEKLGPQLEAIYAELVGS